MTTITTLETNRAVDGIGYPPEADQEGEESGIDHRRDSGALGGSMADSGVCLFARCRLSSVMDGGTRPRGTRASGMRTGPAPFHHHDADPANSRIRHHLSDGLFGRSHRHAGREYQDGLVLFPVMLGVMSWLGLYLRDARVRALIPFRTGYR